MKYLLLRVNSTTVKTSVYYRLVRPTLEYACVAWDPYTKKYINKLEMVHRRAARFVLGRYNYTSGVTKMLQEQNWVPLEQRRQNQRPAMLYKINNGLVEMGNDDLKLRQRRQTRHVSCEGFEVPASRTNYYMWSLIPRTITEWNRLPDSVIQAFIHSFHSYHSFHLFHLFS